MTAKITLLGMWNYLKSKDNIDLFSGLILPEGIEKQDVVDNIMLEAGEFEVLYASPDMMQWAITNFGKKYYRTFEKWYAALNIEYNPLENYRREERVLEEDSFEENYNGGSDTSIENDVTTTDTEERQSEALNKISGYNSNTFQDDTKTTTNSKVLSGNVAVSNDTTNSVTDEYNKSNSGSHSVDSLVYGNIGVTTSQQMLQAELDVARFNLIQQITDLFIQEIVIPVY